MDKRHVAIIVQGLFEKSDSIGYDAVYQYLALKELYGNVQIFAERFNSAIYPELNAGSYADFRQYLIDHPYSTVIYHYCDGWDEVDQLIIEGGHNFIVRWHNNTPPWFYGSTHRRSVERTVKGFRQIVDFIRHGGVKFWVNSNFTAQQLKALGGDASDCAVVFPASRFLLLDKAEQITVAADELVAAEGHSERPLRLLFVSRVVAHKGHGHIIDFAAYLQDVLKIDTLVTFIGRDDPATTLKNDLLSQADSLGVSLTFLGEVSEVDLQEAYSLADLFVCFSEHEGFGMPVFEAMRLGVPVLCWGRTALGELMQDHPFSLPDLDLARAGAAAKSLKSRDVREAIQAIQLHILTTYTRQVVEQQMVDAMAERYGPWQGAALPAQVKDLAARISHELDEAVACAEPVVAQASGSSAREFGENFVNLHDIASYEALLSRGHDLHLLEPSERPTDHAHIPAQDFSSVGTQRVEEGIAFSAAPQEYKSHLIFGPYIRFIPGYFSVEFQIGCENTGDEDVQIEIDVNVDGYGIIARRVLSIGQLGNQQDRTLYFTSRDDRQFLEFRVRINWHGNRNFLFSGVKIRNARQGVANLQPSKNPLGSSSRNWMATLSRESLWTSQLARRHFREGDRMRDRAWWNDAVEYYAQGLNIAPNHFGYLVQYANCLKESGRLEESESAYLRALDIRPHDQDAHLQLGRLYRKLGLMDKSIHHFLIAIGANKSSCEALHELNSSGYNIQDLTRMLV